MKVSRSPGAPARAARALRCALLGAAAAAPFVAQHAHAAASVMIWPIDPVIESGDRAAALWLENRDRRPVTLQVRVLGWREANGEDVYDEDQPRVAGSPPMATVEPGKRQLIRLTRLADTAPGTEQAYRVLIDEIPQPDDDAQPAASGTSLGVKFQMHYSVPLFVYGDGLWTKEHPDRRRDPATAGRPRCAGASSTTAASVGSSCRIAAPCMRASRTRRSKRAARAPISRAACSATCCPARGCAGRCPRLSSSIPIPS
ncbi:hypothetical protein Y034_1509 [Burkholderia pseudomallei MSHR449]|nr:hypothetical protein Y034_1509 [Burkholderia pseudomallei MSHR449]